jgi:3-hydroxyacyl-[acyl-carrier-protein] dehydratase
MNEPSLDRFLELLPQKPPALFVDHILHLVHLEEVEGTVVFSHGHRVFESHLPGEPLVPGVVIVESLAQLAGLTLMDPRGAPIRGYLAEIRAMRFYRLVHPGEMLRLHARLEQAFGRYARFMVEAHVADELAARGELALARKEPRDLVENEAPRAE